MCHRMQRESLWAQVFPQEANSVSNTSWGPAWVASTASPRPAQGPDGCSAHRGADVAGSGRHSIPAAPSMVPATWRRGGWPRGTGRLQYRTVAKLVGRAHSQGLERPGVARGILQGALLSSAGSHVGPGDLVRVQSASVHHLSVCTFNILLH